MAGFDPYLIWLDIPPHERPANYYRLLGLRPLENDPQTISASAERVITHVSRFQQTEHADACNQLLSELTAARDCLLDPVRKRAYDSGFSDTFPSGSPTSSSGTSGGEQPLAGPSAPAGGQAGERPISSPPQAPAALPSGGTGERQIAQSPPVPPSHVSPSPSGHATPNQHGPNQSSSPQPAGGEQPIRSEPPSNAPGEAIPPGVPTSVQPNRGQFGNAQSGNVQSGTIQYGQPYGRVPPGNAPETAAGQSSPAARPQEYPLQAPAGHPTNENPPSGQHHPPAGPPPVPPPASESAASQPAWAQGQRTGEIGTVTPGESSSPQPQQGTAGSRGHRSRQIRRAQRNQSAYLLVGIAMAMIVFFFGAVLLLAIYMGAQ